MFQRYRQESADTARMYGGTGLGLSICHRLTDLMDGRLELDSEPGRGSTFSVTFNLPVSAMPGDMMVTSSSEVTQKRVSPLLEGGVDVPLVLAVDDHPINRDLLMRQIELLGLRAETAENGQVALSLWREGRFALVITDCHMPEMDGYALTQEIRRIEAVKGLARLRMHGFGLSIDDFGTGYSSMQQLMRIAFSELKIDQSFVRDIAHNEAMRIMVESSIGMARKLKVKSVAEGVETQQDWDALKSLKCDIAQGYFIAKPMSLDAFMDYCADADVDE